MILFSKTARIECSKWEWKSVSVIQYEDTDLQQVLYGIKKHKISISHASNKS